MHSRKKNFLCILPSNYIIGDKEIQQNLYLIFRKVLNTWRRLLKWNPERTVEAEKLKGGIVS